MKSPEGIENYVELYELSKRLYFEEFEAIRQLEEKAGRYIAVIGILLAATSIGGKDIFEKIGQLDNILDIVTVILLFASVGLLLWALSALIRIFQKQELSHIPMNQDMIDFFSQHTYLDSIFAMTRGNAEAIKKNREVRFSKLRHLSVGYDAMRFAIAFVGLFTLAIGSRPFITVYQKDHHYSGGTKMSDENTTQSGNSSSSHSSSDKPSENTPQGNKPDASVKPPTFDTVGRGADKPNANVQPPEYVHFSEGYDKKAGEDTSKDKP